MSGGALDATSFAALERADQQLQSLQRTLKVVRAPSSDPLANYSLSRAIQWRAGKVDDRVGGLERFVHDEYVRAGRVPLSPRSVFVPTAAILKHLGASRALQPYQTTVSGSGAELVENTLLRDQFIAALYPRSVALQLGATVVPNLRGDITLPRATTASTAYWLSPASGSPVQSTALTESEQAFDSTPLTLAPCVVGGYAKASRLLMQQSELADAVIANDLASVLGAALDSAVMQGSGASGTPTGITNTSGVNAVSGTTLALAGLISAQQSVVTGNAILNRRAIGWAAPGAVAGLLSARFEASSNVNRLWQGGVDTGTVLGARALATQNMPASTMIFGDWSQALILTWNDEETPVEIETNAFGAGFAAGDIALRMMWSANVAIRHGASFSVISGIT